ncbi:MAG: alpha-glucosidase [Actinomycetaceae bacterium]|nr:alpha-glucosidase [Actinomycetaceae bacterium]
MSVAAQPWWRNATIYQVYPRSFQDSNGDGIGDIRGILQRVPYLARLGIGAVWLSPVYRSPFIDGGYDISDYEDIDPLFGDLGDLDDLIDALHAHGIRLVMDLVVNHTSDQHPWFQASLDPSSAYRDWYIWRPGREDVVAADVAPGQWRGDEPNSWVSAFSGPAWSWHEPSGEYYLHLFAPGQPDLNWENTDVRQAIYSMMRRWLDRGVDGFRMDVINCISKPENLASQEPGGLENAFFGPHFHEWIQEMRREVFDAYPDRDFLTIGECPGATVDDAILTTHPERAELDMLFQFQHMGLDTAGGDKFSPRPLFLPDMKANLAHWCRGLAGQGWNALYLSNHDQPRPVSRFGSSSYREQSATAWAGMLHAHQGTPFVYQGEELAMGNFPWSSISEFDDVETLGAWRDRVTLGDGDPASVWPAIVASSRDNARTPMQWDEGEHASFSSTTPFLPVNPDYKHINAAAQVGIEGSPFEFYRRIIELRKERPILTNGDFELLHEDHPHLWWVRRRHDNQIFDAVANMSDAMLEFDIPAGEVLVSNYPQENGETSVLRPWELRWILR